MGSANAESRRLYVVTETDHTAWIVIGTAIGLTMLPVFGFIRYFVRRATDVGADDILLLASAILSIVQSAVLLRASSYGLGETTLANAAGRVNAAEELFYASSLLFLLSLAASKASTASLLLRLGVTKEHKIAFKAMLAFVALWTVAAIVAMAMQCDLSHPWKLVEANCSGSALRWQVISAFDILFEVAVPAAAAAFVWPLKASISTRISVICAFSFRLILVIIIAIRLANFPSDSLMRDPMLRLDRFVVWTQTQMFWSIISAIIPSLRPFLRGLSTYTEGLGGTSTDPDSQRYPHSSGHELSNMRSTASNMRHARRKSQSTWRGGSEGPKGLLDTISNGIRNTGHGNTAAVRAQKRAEGDDSGSLNSNDSQNMIIQKDVKFSVAWDNSQTERQRQG